MLVQLSITNFAIIGRLDIDFKEGLNVLSGETGAGKSIIINAMNLVLGGRASSDLIRSGCEEAQVEALFSFPENAPVAGLLNEMGLPCDGEALIRRSISREGRNRVSINGSLATVQMLSKLGEGLISISGQHEHQRLLRPETHLYLLDDFGGLSDLRLRVNAAYKTHQELKGEIARLAESVKRMKDQRELTRSQIEEIERAGVSLGEDNALAEEKKRLRHGEVLLKIISESYLDLYERQGSVVSSLSQTVKKLERGAEVDPQLAPIGALLREIEVKLEDASFALRDLRRGVNLDPRRLDEVEERLQLLNLLKRKYGPSLEDVLTCGERLNADLSGLEAQEAKLEDLEKRLSKAEEELAAAAEELSEKRKKASLELEAAVERELRDLHMAATRFQVDFKEPSGEGKRGAERILSDGMDRVEFKIAPNLGEDLRPLARIASGGELSRIMLALKTILARSASVEALIFDEVDAGVSGAAAEMVGEKLLALSAFHQMLCITHLPQIASKGRHHFRVSKEVSDGRTHVVISELDSEGRVNEIARLLGGKKVTPRALAHAREMLGA